MSIAESSQENLNRHQISEQKKISSAILEILNNFVDSDQFELKPNQAKDNSEKESSNNIFVKISLNLWYLLLFTVLFGIINLFLAFFMLRINLDIVYINWLLRLTIFGLWCLLGLVFWRMYRDCAKAIKNVKEKAIIRASRYDVDNYYKVIFRLGNNFNKEDLNKEEIRLSLIINERRYRKNFFLKVIPALAIIFALIGFQTFGIPNYNQITDRFFNAFLNTSGIIAIIKIGLDICNELLSQDVDVVYERCVLILQKAQSIAREIENNKASSSINKNVKGNNLLRELKNIKITGAPRDFSTNFDSFKNDNE